MAEATRYGLILEFCNPKAIRCSLKSEGLKIGTEFIVTRYVRKLVFVRSNMDIGILFDCAKNSYLNPGVFRHLLCVYVHCTVAHTYIEQFFFIQSHPETRTMRDSRGRSELQKKKRRHALRYFRLPKLASSENHTRKIRPSRRWDI